MTNLFNKFTNRRGLFVYGGEASSDYGMVIAEAPSFEKATRKNTIYNVPGRNGAIVFQEDAFSDVGRDYRVWIADDAKKDLGEMVNAFTAWLISNKGYQRLEDSFEPDIFRLAYYNGGDNVSNELMQYGESTISFTCRPERFYKSGEFPISVSNGNQVNNPTRFTAKPLIHIEGSGTVTISIGGNTMSASITDYINIDCDSMNAYRLSAENMNSYISGSFPVILPGINTIGITGTVTTCEITPRFFTI